VDIEAPIGNGSVGDLEVTCPAVVSGMHTGRTVVADGGRLRIVGVLRGDLIVLPGGEIELAGSVSGDVTVRTWGSLVLRNGSVVDGELVQHRGSRVSREPGSVVGAATA
jgi:hypothetical protein